MPVKRFVSFQRYGKVMECWGKLSLSTYRVYLTMYKIHVQRHKYMFGNKQDSIEHTYLKYTTIFHKKRIVKNLENNVVRCTYFNKYNK